MTHRIRDGRPADGAALAVVFRRSTLSNDGDREQMLAQPEVLEFSFPAAEGATVRVVVDEDDRVLAFSTLLEDDGFLELEDLFVDPEAMRTGLGTALIKDATELAQAKGARRIEVTANPHALAFYESVGFVTVGEVSTRFGPAGRMHLPVG